MLPVRVVEYETASSVEGSVVILSLKVLGASAFSAMWEGWYKEGMTWGKHKVQGGNDWGKRTRIRQGKYIKSKSEVGLRWV